MRELLYLYQGSGYLLKEFQIREVKDTVVKAEVCGEKIDPDRHEVKQEIAAVAFHKSRMEKTGNQWTAHLIFECNSSICRTAVNSSSYEIKLH